MSGTALRDAADQRTSLLRWGAAACVAAVLTATAVLGCVGQYPGEGPVVLTFAHDHGLHLGDLLIVAAWAVSMVLLALLARSPDPRPGR